MEVTLVVYDSVLFNRTGQIRRWADTQERAFTRNAIARAPVNKRMRKSHWDWEFPRGSLRASIHGDVSRVGPKQFQTLIHVDVPYAQYVIKGTKMVAPIRPDSAPWLLLPKNFGIKKTRYSQVGGQRANPFLKHAARATARTHSSLRPFAASTFEVWQG